MSLIWLLLGGVVLGGGEDVRRGDDAVGDGLLVTSSQLLSIAWRQELAA